MGKRLIFLFRNRFYSFSLQELTLMIVTFLWGGTFLAIQHGLTASGPLFFVGFRFTTAALFAALLTGPAIRRWKRQEVFAGFLISLAIFAGFFLQTYGLQSIASSKSAFITAFYVPLVPILQWIVLRQSPRLMSWIGIALAFAGLMFVASPDNLKQFTLNWGEIATLGGTVAFAFEVILISRFAGALDSRRITVAQLAFTALLCFVIMPFTQEAIPPFSLSLLIFAGGLGLASAFIQLAMNWAQKSVSPTRATVIYAGEAIWAGIFGYLAGEQLPIFTWIGAALIVAGVIVSEIKTGPK